MATLTERQAEMVQERDQWRAMQTDFSGDRDFFHYCQQKLDDVTDSMEYIRGVLSGRWGE